VITAGIFLSLQRHTHNNMKKTILLFACVVISFSNAMAWGRYGHSTVAYIAEQNLTPKAKKALSEYLHGKTLVSVSSFNDYYKKQMKVDMGYDFDSPKDPRINTLPHTFESNMNFEPNRLINDNGRYVKNCIWWVEHYAEDLKENAMEMDDSTRFAELITIIHLVGDMHCPEHIRYFPEEMTIGYFPVTFRDEQIRFHTLWDDGMITSSCYNWSYSDLAHIVDHFSKKQMKEWTEGDIWAWGSDCARESWPVHQVKKNDVLSKDYVLENWDLLEKQIAKAGHRLAKILNDIFK